ncbi:MAG: hypothetical protein H0Z34_14575 [Brevibacillus sp.]|nr:hypothetical protein [Brevibacillus sp.]
MAEKLGNLSEKNILGVINGPQSTVFFIKMGNAYFVEKIATESGEAELLEQIEFYSQLPEHLQRYFPRLLGYQTEKKPYSMTMEMCRYPSLKDIMIYQGINEFVEAQLKSVITHVHQNIHAFTKSEASMDYVEKQYFERCFNRLRETQSLMKDHGGWLENTLIVNGEQTENPIHKTMRIIRELKEFLVPEFVCTTHGQLGPSHLLISTESLGEYKFVDPKGFHVLHDPILDVCKLGRAFLYGFDWIEDNQFSVDYKIDSETLSVESFKIQGFDRDDMVHCFQKLLSSTIAHIGFPNAELRVYAMVCCDLIASLPFGYKSGGERRLVALMMLIHTAANELFSVAKKKTVKGGKYA